MATKLVSVMIVVVQRSKDSYLRHFTHWQKEVDAMVEGMLPPLAMCKDMQSLRADATTTFLPAFFEAQKENSDPKVRMVCEYLRMVCELKDLAD